MLRQQAAFAIFDRGASDSALLGQDVFGRGRIMVGLFLRGVFPPWR
jgi:hypothetical protein